MPLADKIVQMFRRAEPLTRGPVLDAVRRAGFSVENIQESRSDEKWGLILKPNRRLTELFRLDREVLLWCSTYPTFQARDIDDMRFAMQKLGVRLSRSFAILVTRYDADSRSRVEAESTFDTTIVHCSIRDLAIDRGEVPALQQILLKKLYTRDLYDLPNAVTRAADFFGRRRTLDDMTDEIVTGQSQLGVFGLRKIGKTSLTNRVIGAVSQSGRCIVAKVDLQWTTSIDPRPEYTLWSLGEALYASGRIVRGNRDLRLFGQYPTASAVDAAGVSIWEEFAHDMRAVLDSTTRRIFIAIDEIERQLELKDPDGFVRFWRVLRGLDQQYPGRIRILVSGTSPECAEQATLAGADNPLYRYLSVRYLGPLDEQDSRDLLTNLGEPIGLSWTSAALDYAVQQTGGHPALLRMMGSVIHSSLSPREGRTDVTADATTQAARQIVTSNTAVLAQITASLQDQYADEFVMLQMLAEGQVFNFRQLAREYPDELSHLIGYGLLPDGEQSERPSISLLQTYIQTLGDKSRSAAAEPAIVSVGDVIGNYRVVANLKSGGFADVVLAEQVDGQKVAIKVFRSALLSSLEREVEYLQSLRNHPGVVRFIEATKAPSGAPCLVMEYLEGATLADRCNATTAPGTEEFLNIAEQLMNALIQMHPDIARAKALADQAELSADELEAWERSRHGIVHRDIKPENVMLTSRGAVLIDFNISVRAADSVVTISATPGYLPPGFNGVAWTPDVDMYQAGVTLAQLAAGTHFDGTNLADLMELAGSRHGAMVRSWLEKLTAPTSRPTANEAARKLYRLTRR